VRRRRPGVPPRGTRRTLMDMDTALSLRLRTETADLHRLAERSGIMHDLLRGRLERGAYVALLRGLHVVYASLERRLDALADTPEVRGVYSPALRRAESLAADLVALHGPRWARELSPGAGAQAYARRIEDASPSQLVAHAYVRYMGDLSGGQALGRVIARALALDGETGTAFYRFPDIPDTEAFKEAFRSALDIWPLDAAGADDVVREAQRAFRLNVTVFEEVATPGAPSAALPPPPVA